MKKDKVQLKQVTAPKKDCPGIPVPLADMTMAERREKVLAAMRKKKIEQLVIYGDAEHGGNFEYLVGYYTRFEEGLLVVKADGRMNLVLGNENLNKASKACVEAGSVHVPLFSLPNQPGRDDKSLAALLKEAGLEEGKRTGIAGWKMFTSPIEKNEKMYEAPSFIIDAIRDIAGDGNMTNETSLFIGKDGVRTTNNANEIAHYEFGAALASDCMLDAMDLIDEGVTEMELGDRLVRYGQHTSVVTIAASGPRFVRGNMYPTENRIKVGDPIALTVGYRGGLSSRAGYAVRDEREMPDGMEDYLTRVAMPYFHCYASWLVGLKTGMKGGDLYALVEQVLPKAEYHWNLCPGHLTAEEEWMSSPVYEGSEEIIKSGMIFQVDIIPSVPGYGGVSAESTIAIADEALREEIRSRYPAMWERMQERRAYLKDVLGIPVSEEILPMCSTVAYLRPYLLDKDKALTWGWH